MTYLWTEDGMDYDRESPKQAPRAVIAAALLGGVLWLVGFWLVVTLVWAAAG